MSHQESNPKSRREVWLSVALAVARDGMPEPIDFDVDQAGHSAYLRAAGRAEFDRWVAHLGVKVIEPMLSSDGVRNLLRARANRDADGWYWTVQAYVPIDAEPEPSDLAEQVVAAILADADDLPSDSKTWACPNGCGYHIVDGPVPDGEPPTWVLIRNHLEEHALTPDVFVRETDERCPDPECGEPLRLIEAGLVGHCGRTCGPELADAEVSA